MARSFAYGTSFKTDRAALRRAIDQEDAAWVYATTRQARGGQGAEGALQGGDHQAGGQAPCRPAEGRVPLDEGPMATGLCRRFHCPRLHQCASGLLPDGREEVSRGRPSSPARQASAQTRLICAIPPASAGRARCIRMHFDSRVTNQAPPPGITVNGPLDVQFLRAASIPPFTRPPAILLSGCEAMARYRDVLGCFLVSFHVRIHHTEHIGPNAYVWGYLAARKGGRG